LRHNIKSDAHFSKDNQFLIDIDLFRDFERSKYIQFFYIELYNNELSRDIDFFCNNQSFNNI